MRAKAIILVPFLVCVLVAALFADQPGQTSADTAYLLEEIWATPADSIFDLWKNFFPGNWQGKPVQKETLERLVSDLLHVYSQNGFPFAEISPRVEEAGAGKARLQLAIVTGPAVYVSRLQCAAFSAGEQKQLARMLAFYPGYFDEREVEGLKNRAQQFPELVWNGEPKLVEAPDFSSTRLDLPLSRRAKNRVEGGLGYLPSGLDDGAFGELSVQLVTLGKIGREADFRWSRPNSRSRFLTIGYQDFFLVPAAFYVFGDLGQEEREEQFFRFSIRAGFSAFLSGKWKGGLSVEHDRITPREERLPYANDSTAARQYGLGIELRRGEGRLTEEVYFSLRLGVQYKRVFYGNGVKRGTTKQAGFEASRIFRIGPNGRLFLKGRGEIDFVPALLFTRSDLFYLGGYGSVRGYPDESFSATRCFLGRAEPRFFLGVRDYLFGFFDFAHLSIGKNYSGLSVADPFKPGVGLGISAGDDRLNLTFGWGEKTKIKDGIVYLRLAGEL